jgi:hypothetical protein
VIQDTINSIKATLHDRATSPLFGTFALSWLVWNHRAVAVMLSPLPYADKFRYIDTTLYGPQFSWQWWVFLFLGPLISTVLFLVVYPYPAHWAFKYWRSHQKKLKAIQQKIEDEMPVTQEEARKLRRELEDLVVDHDKQMVIKNAQVEAHKRDLLDSQTNEIQKRDLLAEANKKLALAEDQIQQLGRTSASVIRPEEVQFPSVIDKKYRLYFNPTMGKGKSKVIAFADNGVISEGNNDNENSWRIASGRLELLNAKGTPHSRFGFDQRFGVFVMIEDEALPAIKNQYMVPEL